MAEYAHIRSAFREAALGLMGWQDPLLMGRAEYRRLELLEPRRVYRPYDPQGDVEPYDVSADWEETA